MIFTVLQSELDYYARLYAGFAQEHFARPAVRAFRKHLVHRMVDLTKAGPSTRVLSVGCGIGDTELLLAEHVSEVVGIDTSTIGIRQARMDAEKAQARNVRFVEQAIEEMTGQFDVVCAIFLLHHLSDEELSAFPRHLLRLLAPGGIFYSLDPSKRRLSGAVGRIVVPWLMKKYQTEGERELVPEATGEVFQSAGFSVQVDMYDFGSTPVAGLFPGWRWGYDRARQLDDQLLKLRPLKRIGSNFEIIARRPPSN